MDAIKRPDFSNYFEEPLEALEAAKDFFKRLDGKNYISSSAKVLENSLIEPPCYIGKNSVIGPFAHIRPYTFIDDNCAVGSFSIIKGSVVLEGTHIPHQNYVGDSIIGENCNLGAGTKTANLRFDEKNVKITYHGKRIDSGRKKLGAIIGDNVKFGINCSVMPGVKIGSGCRIGASVLVDMNLEENVFYGYRNGGLIKEKINGRTVV